MSDLAALRAAFDMALVAEELEEEQHKSPSRRTHVTPAVSQTRVETSSTPSGVTTTTTTETSSGGIEHHSFSERRTTTTVTEGTTISEETLSEIARHATFSQNLPTRVEEGHKREFQKSEFYVVDQSAETRSGMSPRRSTKSGLGLEELESALSAADNLIGVDPNVKHIEVMESPRHTRNLTKTETVEEYEFYGKDFSTRSAAVAKEQFKVPDVGYDASRGMDMQGIETSAELLLTPRGGKRGTFHEDVLMSPRSTMEKKSSSNWAAEDYSMEAALKRIPKLEQGTSTEEHVYSDKHKTVQEKLLPERTTYTSEEVAVKEAVTPLPEYRDVQQIVEHIVKVPRVVQKHREVIREVPVHRTIQKTVEVPRIEKRVIKKPVTKWNEEVVLVPKIKYVDEVIEVPVPVHIVEEVVEVVERLIPTFVTKHVKKVVEQFNDIIQLVERKQERVIEVPKYRYERVVVEIPVEVIEEEIRYVEVPQVVEKINILKVQQIQEEVVTRQVTKVVTKEVIREVPVVKKVIREVEVDRIVQVATKVQIPREVVVYKEQIVEVPRYVANIKHIYHHTGHEIQYRQKEIQHHKKRVVNYIGEQKQVVIRQNVVHVPKFVEVEVIEWIDLVTESPIEIFKEELVEVPKIMYEDVEEEVVVEKTRKKFVEVETEHVVKKFVQVPEHRVLRVPKIVFADNTQIIENIVEVPEIVYKDRVVEKIVDVWEDTYVEVEEIKKIEEFVEVPVVKKVTKIVEVPVIQHVEKTVEVPEIQKVIKYVDEVTIEEVVKYVDMHVDVLEEEIVEVPIIKNIEVPELEIVDVNIYVPQVKKVGVIMEIECEVHHDVFEEMTTDITVDIERREDVVHDRIHVNDGELDPRIEQTHSWDTSRVPAEYRSFTLPALDSEGRTTSDL